MIGREIASTLTSGERVVILVMWLRGTTCAVSASETSCRQLVDL